MTRPGFYLCGCNIAEKQTYNYRLDPETGNPILGRKDEYGFDVCPEHGYRRYGWRTDVLGTRGVPFTHKLNDTPIRGQIEKDLRDNRDPAEVVQNDDQK